MWTPKKLYKIIELIWVFIFETKQKFSNCTDLVVKGVTSQQMENMYIDKQKCIQLKKGN